MYNIERSNCLGGKSTVAAFATYEAAADYAVNVMRAAYIEPDSDHPGCADFVVFRGMAVEVYAINLEVWLDD